MKTYSVSITTSNKNRIILDDCFIEYFDLISNKLKLPFKYSEFQNKDDAERQSIIRDLKLNKLIYKSKNDNNRSKIRRTRKVLKKIKKKI